MAGCGVLMLLRLDLPTVLLFPLLIISLAKNKSKVSRVLSFPIFYFLGTISFSLYLLHQLFRPTELALVQAFHPVALSGSEALLFAFLGSLSVLPFAWLAYRFIERPGRTFIRSLSNFI